jgi:hypothetical protein
MQNVLPGLPQLTSRLTTILLDPRSDPTAALLLYATIGLALLLVLVVAMVVLWGSPDEDEESKEPGVGEASEGVAPTDGGDGGPSRSAPSARTKVPVPPLSPRTRAAVAAVVVVVLVAAWAITGYTTSDPALCKSCHWPASEHAKATAGTDAHAKVSCVSCHEPGGIAGLYVTDVPARLLHFADSQSPASQQGEYGRVTVAACSSCHMAALAGVSTEASRGLKVSHKEPLAASATCLDCHAPRAGVVGAHNAGMTPCLRCHDSKQASAKCATCHDDKAASAARARTTSFAREQIPEVSCGGCHNEKRECDGCHGVRLPHSVEFRSYAHARAGAVDFWFNGGKACARCHTATRRPCQKCHSKLLGRAHGAAASSELALSHQRSSSASCNTCHGQYAYSKRRDFCKDVCHTPAAIAGSPR